MPAGCAGYPIIYLVPGNRCVGVSGIPTSGGVRYIPRSGGVTNIQTNGVNTGCGVLRKAPIKTTLQNTVLFIAEMPTSILETLTMTATRGDAR